MRHAWFDTPMPSPDYASWRLGYEAEPFLESQLAPTPLGQFDAWFSEASDAGLVEPNAMTLATVDADGAAAARTVLLKGLDGRGFLFASNYTSAKGHEIANNANVALVFAWLPMSRQVCIRGTAMRAPYEESRAYFYSRPKGHQIGAVASAQSQVIADREVLRRAYERVEAASVDEVAMPSHWGLFVVNPVSVEFWQGQASRLHDRLRYRRVSDGSLDDASAWTIERLAP